MAQSAAAPGVWSLVQSNDRGHHPRFARVHVALRRPAILVARVPLRHDRIAGVLDIPRNEFMPDGVPREALRSAVVQPGELEQLAPHPLETLNGSSGLGAEHVRFR